MTVLKIKRDIDLLEKQLNEIEINIADPIERIEHKKQLERKIKKLERSRSQIEQLEQEQQELESLKSEFSSNNNKSINRREVKSDKQVEYTASIIDNYTTAESSIDLGKQIENNQNSQASNSNYTEQNLGAVLLPTPVISPSNNSKESGKAWIIGGTIGFFIFLGLLINGYQVNQTASNIERETSVPIELEQSPEPFTQAETSLEQSPEPFTQAETSNDSQEISSITLQEAVNLLEKWQNAKRQIFAPPFNRELGAELLTGKTYYDNIGNSEGSVSWLQNNASYYIYGVQSIDSVEKFSATENYATIEVVVTEDRTLYNKYGKIDRNASGFDTRLVRYNLESEYGQWRIADYQTIRKIK